MIHPTIHKRKTPVPIADLEVPKPGPVKTMADLPPDVINELRSRYERGPQPNYKPTKGRGKRRIKLRKKKTQGYGSQILYLAVNNME